MKFTLTLILNTWGYAEKDDGKEYCRVEVKHDMVFTDWDDVNNVIGYLTNGASGKSVTFSVKAEQEVK